MLMNEKALRERIYSVYRTMKTSAGPKKYRRGKKKGQLMKAGTELPFTKEDLWQHALNQVGEGLIACPYCMESGRQAIFISLEDCVFDHHVPKSRGGSWELSNLAACCRQCNTEKGEFTYEFFLHLIDTIRDWHDMPDRAAAYKLLRSQGFAHQFHFDKSKSLPNVVADVMNLEF